MEGQVQADMPGSLQDGMDLGIEVLADEIEAGDADGSIANPRRICAPRQVREERVALEKQTSVGYELKLIQACYGMARISFAFAKSVPRERFASWGVGCRSCIPVLRSCGCRA